MAALANNLDLQIDVVEPAIAQQAVDEERAKYEATFNASAAYLKNDAAAAHTEQQLYSAGITIPTRAGGSASISTPYFRSEPATDPYQAGLRFSISQPLLRDAGFEANSFSIRAAEYQKHIIDAQTKLQAIRILASADRAYWLLYAARSELLVNQEIYELASRQVDQAHKRVAAQASPRIEITRAESGAAARLEGIIVAETIVRRRERDLKRIMNRPDLPIDSAISVIPTNKPNPVHLLLSSDELAKHAVANRLEMLQLELQLALDAASIDFQRNQALPLFMLDYHYNLLRNAPHSGDSFELWQGNNFPDWSLELRGEIPIGNEAAKARVHRAILERIQRLSTREQQKLAIEQDVFDAVDELNQDWQRILAARNETILAARTYEAEQRQFEVGARTSTDVLDAAQSVSNAQSREVQALTDYEIGQIDLAFATGTLLGRERVQLPTYRR
jgi:outer membrane protein TolC